MYCYINYVRYYGVECFVGFDIWYNIICVCELARARALVFLVARTSGFLPNTHCKHTLTTHTHTRTHVFAWVFVCGCVENWFLESYTGNKLTHNSMLTVEGGRGDSRTYTAASDVRAGLVTPSRACVRARTSRADRLAGRFFGCYHTSLITWHARKHARKQLFSAAPAMIC